MKIKLIRKIKQRIRDISNVWSVAGIRNVYVMAILPHFGSKSTRDIRRERKQQAILHYLQTNYQNLILKYTQKEEIPPASNQAPIWVCWWQGENAMPPIKVAFNLYAHMLAIIWFTLLHKKTYQNMLLSRITSYERFRKEKSHLLIFQIFSVCVCSMSMEAYG